MIKIKNTLLFNAFFLLCITVYLGANPRLSIITSVYNGDEYIEQLIQDIIKQTIFQDCELLLIDAHSPGNEKEIIKKYTQEYPNIRYIYLDYDPGVYGVWNIGIILAKADYITNANLDDIHNPDYFERALAVLDADPLIDLVYSDYYITYHSHDSWAENHIQYVAHIEEFLPQRMNLCLPGPQPVWRKSLHIRFGYFDTTFLFSGDWEFWNRAVEGGAQFKKIDGISGIYYYNPEGLSTTENPIKSLRRAQENNRIITQYSHGWFGFGVQ